jgi:hypothetical protein
VDRQPLNEQEQSARKELTLLVSKVLEGQCSYLEAAPQILGLRSRLGGVRDFDEDFLAFVVISSETDSLPTQATRHLWSERPARELEPEIAKHEKWAADLGSKSCSALIARFG